MLVTVRNFIWGSARRVSIYASSAGRRRTITSSVNTNLNPSRVSKLTSFVPLERFESHPLHKFGYPQERSTHGYMPEFVLARALQRNPNARVRENLNLLHKKLSERLDGMSDEALEWLLGGVNKTGRGKFKNVSKLKEFLNSDLKDIKSSQLISRLELLTTAIGYRAIQAKWAQDPTTPQTPDQKKMFDVACAITHGQMVRPINSVYTQRASDRVSHSCNSANVIFCEQDDELSDDEDDAFQGQPNEKIPSAYFKVISDNGQQSWVSKASDNGVHVRNHTSGTSPLNLSVVVGLLREPGESYAAILDNEGEARELFTALLMPKYLRSDYHSLAETQTGIDHFFAEIMHKKDNTLPLSKEIDPITAEQRAYDAMCNAICDEVTDQGIPLKQAMENYCLILLEEKQKQRSSVEEYNSYEVEHADVFVPDEDYSAFMENAKREFAAQREAILQRTYDKTLDTSFAQHKRDE